MSKPILTARAGNITKLSITYTDDSYILNWSCNDTSNQTTGTDTYMTLGETLDRAHQLIFKWFLDSVEHKDSSVEIARYHFITELAPVSDTVFAALIHSQFFLCNRLRMIDGKKKEDVSAVYLIPEYIYKTYLESEYVRLV